ncbi:MAG: sulfotransferase family 2 domain-containing protein [Planctomycetaceae bacterium]|nr:sulfotransferase family 2 domain-containing protein [Planctomycetaceae bacterium]
MDAIQNRLRLRQAHTFWDGQPHTVQHDGVMFLHVSKSGGTSFDNFLAGFFPAGEMLPTDLQVKRIVEWNADDWSRYRYFKLEWPYQAAARLAPPLHFVTMLRDPVRRIVSLYKHLSRKDDHTERYESVRARRSPEQDAARRLSLAEWARLSYPEPGAYYRHPYLGMATIGVWNMRDKSQAELDELLELGKQNLRDKFTFTGVLEDYRLSKQVFCRTFGLPEHHALSEERLNVAPEATQSGNESDAETLAYIRHENRWDVALYDYARQLLIERADQLAPSLCVDAREQIDDVDAIGHESHNIDHITGSGLFPVETTEQGQSLRWTGSLPVSTLDLIGSWPSRGSIQISLDIVLVLEPKRLSELQLRLDGRPPRSTRFESISGGTRLVAEFDLSSEISGRVLHQLQLDGPTSTPPTAPGQPRDSRRLGVGLSRIAWRWNTTANHHDRGAA